MTGNFLPIAIASGLAVEVGLWVVRVWWQTIAENDDVEHGIYPIMGP